MSYGNSNAQLRIGGPLTPAVKVLLIVNFSIFLIQQVTKLAFPGLPEYVFGLSHNGIMYNHFIWQLFTYMFLHSGWLHIIFNMLGLWMFAGELEQTWGTKFFVKFYLLSGLGAGFFIALLNAFMALKSPAFASAPTLGASGALYALLLAYGILWPNREVLIWFILPIKMKYMVLFFGIFEFFGTLNSMAGIEGNVSHIGHIGGLITGFIILKIAAGRKNRFRKNKLAFFPGLLRSFRLRRKRNVINTRIKAKETIDILLDKIARQGMASLTAAERKDLEWARKHYYPGNDEMIH